MATMYKVLLTADQWCCLCECCEDDNIVAEILEQQPAVKEALECCDDPDEECDGEKECCEGGEKE